mmetsp:Transcript_115244/g.273933  ORF Transcript_115244/g.273933 Transcript_115244/m.273933 type:complete len:246 (-) Transcript_115244:120-857(-)
MFCCVQSCKAPHLEQCVQNEFTALCEAQILEGEVSGGFLAPGMPEAAPNPEAKAFRVVQRQQLGSAVAHSRDARRDAIQPHQVLWVKTKLCQLASGPECLRGSNFLRDEVEKVLVVLQVERLEVEIQECAEFLPCSSGLEGRLLRIVVVVSLLLVPKPRIAIRTPILLSPELIRESLWLPRGRGILISRSECLEVHWPKRFSMVRLFKAQCLTQQNLLHLPSHTIVYVVHRPSLRIRLQLATWAR